MKTPSELLLRNFNEIFSRVGPGKARHNAGGALQQLVVS
jgi:hypothetical protein